MSKDRATVGRAELEIKKNWYSGLWEIRYVDGVGPGPWAGPYRTRGEARERLANAVEEAAEQ